MKKHLLSAALLCSAAAAQAQSVATLDAGNIRSSIGTRGYMWNDSATGTPRCEYPKGSGKHVGYTAGLWVGGYDGQAQLKVAGNRYYTTGNDFVSGPYLPNAGPANSMAWERVWSVTRAQVDSAVAGIGATPPLAIREWPARGNVSARGANGAPLPELQTTSETFAPFVDVDGNGIYNWQAGDVPALRGDQMTWTVYNDVGGTKTATGSGAVPVQIAQLSWAFNRPGTIGNIQFYEYTIINRSSSALDSAVVGMFSDLDLGAGFDDYAGFDSARRTGYVYNARIVDGNGEPSSYGSQIPIVGVTLLRSPGDNAVPGTRVPAGAFAVFTNGGTPATSDPTNALEYYYIMTRRNRLGQPVYKYAFDGEPAVPNSWNECYVSNIPGDRRFVLSAERSTIPAGGNLIVAVALIVSPDADGCPTVNLTGLKQAADTAFGLYNGTVSKVDEVPFALATPSIYPNPTTGALTVSLTGLGNGASLQIVDALGRELAVPATRTPRGWDVQGDRLPAGIYRVVIRETDGRTSAATFVKQ